MRNIFIFLRQHMTLVMFIVLQGFSLWMLFSFNRYHHGVGMGIAGEVTGRINTQVDKLDDYFHQGEENRRLHHMNDSLLNLLHTNFYAPDTAQKLMVDSTTISDTVRGIRRYYWREAKVVFLTVNSEKNFLQINRGANNGIKDNMAVLNSDGAVVGLVITVGPNFSTVMPLLHVQNSVSAAIKKTGDAGKVEWDGKDPRFVTLKGIAKSVQVKIGDTIITSRYSYNFPPDKMIGTVAGISSDPASGFYLLKVKTAVSFATVQQVFVVENLQRDEQLEQLKETEKKVDQQKPKNH